MVIDTTRLLDDLALLFDEEDDVEGDASNDKPDFRAIEGLSPLFFFDFFSNFTRSLPFDGFSNVYTIAKFPNVWVRKNVGSMWQNGRMSEKSFRYVSSIF